MSRSPLITGVGGRIGRLMIRRQREHELVRSAKTKRDKRIVEGVRFFVYGLGGFDSFWDASLEADCELQERRVPSPVPSAPVLLGVADGQV